MGKSAAPRRGPIPGTVPHSVGFKAGIDFDKLGQLADEMEAEGLAEKLDDLARRERLVHARNADSAVNEAAGAWWDACPLGLVIGRRMTVGPQGAA